MVSNAASSLFNTITSKVIRPQILNVDASLYPATLNSAPMHAEEVVEKNEEDATTEEAETHPDERQVRLDTDRSFVLYPVGEPLSIRTLTPGYLPNTYI